MNSEIILPYSIKKHSDISFEILERNQVLNYEILYEEVDVSFETFQEHSLHSFLEEKFDNVQVEIQFEHPCHDKHITEFSARSTSQIVSAKINGLEERRGVEIRK